MAEAKPDTIDLTAASTADAIHEPTSVSLSYSHLATWPMGSVIPWEAVATALSISSPCSLTYCDTRARCSSVIWIGPEFSHSSKTLP
ncbi:MAG: hypothetical protein QXX25_02990 [Thermofilaceae archaeon]